MEGLKFCGKGSAPRSAGREKERKFGREGEREVGGEFTIVWKV